MIPDITITSLETITAFDITTGAYKFTLDELQNATIAQTQEKNDIVGKQGRKLSSIKRNKGATISGTNGIISCGLLEMQTGCEFKNGAVQVLWTDYITVPGSGADVKTEYVAVGTAGSELIGLYLRNSDGTLGTQLVQDASAAAGKFAYNPSTKVITLHTDVAPGTELVAYYKRNIVADTLSNESDHYSGKCKLYVDAIGEDRCANVYRLQFYFPKADFDGEFSLEMGDNQAVQEFTAEALGGACGNAATFFTYTVFGVNTADTPVA